MDIPAIFVRSCGLWRTPACQPSRSSACSPDFHPFEVAFAPLNTQLLKAAARMFDAVTAAIGRGLDAITPAHLTRVAYFGALTHVVCFAGLTFVELATRCLMHSD